MSGQINVDVMQTSAGPSLGAGNASIMKNRIINGGMTIAQRGTGAVTSNSSTQVQFPVDRFQMYTETGSTGAFSGQQSSSAPAGFNNSLLITTTTANASPSAAYGYELQQRIEGFNFADLGFGTANAKTVTLSFWVQSSLTGTFAGSLTNGSFNRSYVFNYSIPVANTWTYVSITIPGDTGGTWAGATNGIGAVVYFNIGAGSNWQQTANTWGGFGFSTAGSVQLIATLSATLNITGVQLEVGSSATGYEYRQYQQELALCQRYYEKSYNIDVVPGTSTQVGLQLYDGSTESTGSAYGYFNFKVSKRATASMTFWNDVGTSGVWMFNSAAIGNTAKTITASFVGMNSAGFQIAASSANYVSSQYYGHWAASAEL